MGVVEWAIAACASFGCSRVLRVGFDRWRPARGMRIEALACKVGYESQWPRGACSDVLEEQAASNCGDAKTATRILTLFSQNSKQRRFSLTCPMKRPKPSRAVHRGVLVPFRCTKNLCIHYCFRAELCAHHFPTLCISQQSKIH